MAQRNKKSISKNLVVSTDRDRRSTRTKLEQLSPEIFFNIFDYLSGNAIRKAFYGLNSQINQIVHNTPNVHLDFSRTTRKSNQSFQQIFLEKNIVSVILSDDDRKPLERLFNSSECKRLKSVRLSGISLYSSEIHLANILGNFKDQIMCLKVGFDSMQSADGSSVIRETFLYLLTQLPLLKRLEFSGLLDHFSLEHMDSMISNHNVTDLTFSVNDYSHWWPLLHRLPKLKSLKLDFIFKNEKKRVASRDSTCYFGCQAPAWIAKDHSFPLRHVRLSGFNMIMENFENLFQLVVTPKLLTLMLFDCKRPVIGMIQPTRKPPFLNGTKWHDLTKKYFRSTLKQFHVEFTDVDNIMSMTNVQQIEKDLIKYNGGDPSCRITCSFCSFRKLLAFDFKYI